jgi:hypothetical protein
MPGIYGLLKRSRATKTKAGAVLQGAHVPNAAAAPTKAEFDALLTSLRNSGTLASS